MGTTYVFSPSQEFACEVVPMSRATTPVMADSVGEKAVAVAALISTTNDQHFYCSVSFASPSTCALTCSAFVVARCFAAPPASKLRPLPPPPRELPWAAP